MQANLAKSLAQQLLPRQKNRAPTKLLHSYKTSFFSNIFEIKLKKENLTLYQYSLETNPKILADSDGLIQKIKKVIAYELKTSIGYICSKGMMIWGWKDAKIAQTLKAQFQRDQQKYSYEVLVKPVSRLDLETFVNEHIENIPSILQALNINVKELLRHLGMVELNPGSYYQNQESNINSVQGKLKVWGGHKITVTTYNKKLYLQIDPCSRVLRLESFLETIDFQRKRLNLQEINLKYKGSPVLRRYGSPRIYRVDQIDYNLSPKSLFFYSKEGKEVSYLYYYSKEYNVTIKNPNQPLLKARQAKKRRFKSEGFHEFIYLVPELVHLTGLTEDQRSNFRLMKSLGQYTILSAQERMRSTQQMAGRLSNSGELIFQIRQKEQPLNGFIMDQPRVLLHQNKQKRGAIKQGSINLRQKILEPFNFQNIVYCYSFGENKGQDQDDADYAYDLLKEAGRSYGISVYKEPIYLQVKDGYNVKDWEQVLLSYKKNVDIVLLLMKPNEIKFYPQLKEFITSKLNVPSQFVKKTNLSSSNKNSLSIAAKVILQMNAKMGHSLWCIANSHSIWRDEVVAVCGIASSNAKKGECLALTGSISRDLTNYFSECKLIQKKEENCAALFQTFFKQWMRSWFNKNGNKLPSVLVIYREGMNQVQAKLQAEIQINGLLQAIRTVKNHCPNFNPTIVYLLVNKKPNSRIFEKQRETFKNPTPGSIIFEELSDGLKEFHLASVFVRNGSCTPVSFKVCYENRPEFPFEAIAELTYNQTYSYFNWLGSVRVPAALQYANKLAKQYSEIGDSLKLEKNSDLKTKLFYL